MLSCITSHFHFSTEFNITFPCTGTANGTSGFTLNFSISSTSCDIPTQTISLNLTGTKRCNCTAPSCFPTDPGPGDPPDILNNNIFYIVISCVGVLIAIVIAAVVFYHCVMLKGYFKNRSDLEEE